METRDLTGVTPAEAGVEVAEARAHEVLPTAVKGGLVAGVVLIFLGMVGMIEKFEGRNLIHDTVTLGKLLLALPPFIAGYLVVRPRVRAGQVVRVPPRLGALAGLATGAAAGGLTSAGVALAGLLRESARGIFISVSPGLLDVVTFGRGVAAGAAILILGGAVLGAAGVALELVPSNSRRRVFVALGVALLFALLQRILRPALVELGVPIDWLYSRTFSGLTRLGSVVVFGAALALPAAWGGGRGRELRGRMGLVPGQQAQRAARLVGLLVVLGILLVLPQLIGSALSNILGQVGIFLLMGLGLNIVVGYAGLLDLGYVAFFAVGAYVVALITGANLVTSLGATASPSFSLSLNFYLALPLVILAAAFVGLLIGAPVLRLRGDYLAIVTLGFGEIARVLSESQALKSFVGGAQGLRDVTDAAILGYGFRQPQHFYYLVLALVLTAVYVSWRLANSRIGRAWNAMREDEQVAEAMGISTIKYKLLAFAMGGAVGSLSGVLFAVQLNTVQPGSFTILVSITALAVIILGGMGSIPGVVVGGLVLIGLPGLLTEFEEFRLLIYGAVIILIMILRPQGLIPNVRRMRELTEEERLQDAWLKKRLAEVEAEGAAAPTIAGGGGAGPGGRGGPPR